MLTLTASASSVPRAATTASAVRRPIPGTSVMSSMVADRSRFSEPNFFISAFRRVSPSPGMPSSADVVIALERFCRW